MRRFLLPGVVVAAAVALLALLAFGVSSQGTNTSIDSSVARGIRPAAPNAGDGAAGPRLLREARASPTSAARSWCSTCSPRGAGRAGPRRRSSTRSSGRSLKHGGTILGRHVPRQLLATPRRSSARSTSPTRCVRDVSGNFVRSFGTNGVPETFVIDRNGRIAALRRYQLAGTWLRARCRADPGSAVVSPPTRPSSSRSRRPLLAGGRACRPRRRSPPRPRTSLTAIWNDVMCVSCHEPLAVAQSPQAIAERNYIRRLVAQGDTKAQIERALVAQYGPVRARQAARPRLQPHRLRAPAGDRCCSGSRSWRSRCRAGAAASRAAAASRPAAAQPRPRCRRRAAPGGRAQPLPGLSALHRVRRADPEQPERQRDRPLRRDRQRDPERLDRLRRRARPPGRPRRRR